MNKLSDNEIIKALEELLKELKSKKQLIVPEQGVKNLCYGLQNFLDLINRQKAEIERLTFENAALSQSRVTLYERIKLVNDTRTKAIKEVAEEIKIKTLSMVRSPDLLFEEDYINCIDNVVKEMVGDNE